MFQKSMRKKERYILLKKVLRVLNNIKFDHSFNIRCHIKEHLYMYFFLFHKNVETFLIKIPRKFSETKKKKKKRFKKDKHWITTVFGQALHQK